MSSHIKRFPFSSKPGNLTSFADVCGVHPKNKPFRDWIKNTGCLKEEKNGEFTIDGKKLLKYLEETCSEMKQIRMDIEKVKLDGFL